MKKKQVKSRLKKHSPKKKTSYSSYTLAGFVIIALLLVGNLALRPIEKPYVLGTSVFLAEDGGATGNTGENPEPTVKYPDAGTQTPQAGTASVTPPPDGKNPTNLSPTAYVDCIGPDGKHFQTTFKACYELNHSFHHDNFSFTALKPTKPNSTHEFNTSLSSPSAEFGKLPLNLKGGSGSTSARFIQQKLKGDLGKGGIELKNDSNKTTAQFKMPDGSAVEIDEKQALDEINNQLSSLGINIEKSAGNNFSIKKNNVKAQTNLPLSLDPSTKDLTITTAGGVKTIKVLPDEAIQRAFLAGNINSSEGESKTASASAATTPQTTLTSLNNEAVFKINGFSNKKALGFIPVSFAKTVFVSAENGSIVKTDETFFSKLLEAFSF